MTMGKDIALVPFVSASLALPSPGRRLVEAFLSGRNARTLEAYGREILRVLVGSRSKCWR